MASFFPPFVHPTDEWASRSLARSNTAGWLRRGWRATGMPAACLPGHDGDQRYQCESCTFSHDWIDEREPGLEERERERIAKKIKTVGLPDRLVARPPSQLPCLVSCTYHIKMPRHVIRFFRIFSPIEMFWLSLSILAKIPPLSFCQQRC